MRVVRTEGEMTRLSLVWRDRGLRVGFVPTMGALHAGHLSLVDAARETCDRVVVSIFVNPTQFGKNEDLSKYPRDLQGDCRLLEERGVSAVFAPDNDVIYPEGFSTTVSVSGVSSGLCGEYRPGHFQGVATVCAVLFGIVRPHAAVFGMKDAQQLAVIRRMVRDLRLEPEIIAAPIVREHDGLAMSSRNAYLSPEERRQAPAISRGLNKVRMLRLNGEMDPAVLKAGFLSEVEPMNLLKVQYVEVVDHLTMAPLEKVTDKALMAVAVYAGATRLIDNIIIEPEA
ncbi:MAG TPA: pantoate--beta-alanine ligase [Candidatus Sabulitectum sp.]|nr:pantoate--beta-alanine ligase [Candidatus Sabulitectum sp.]HPF32611.1 pantoate--beta-alanine ligase [Candidatus Sabulitectum sp.]HPJ28179.1 pantoate--beta-alanine ligase [Candidatus Sabulitectum sp.]HPR21845.1 pantoate--beta-alanine ligase [Candidatus Sabulitectum sp.]